ncbi:MAG: tetratricopeptide repeat protein [Planctomycetes bacterium]|nr:tetratricopeptide repeat protein [Planctomycetota bacterium]
MSLCTPVLLCVMTGCTSMGFTPPWKKTEAKAEGPKDSITLVGGRGFVAVPVDPEVQREFDAAKRLFDEKKYAQAEPLFNKLVKLQAEPHWWEIGILAPDSKSDKKEKIRRRGGDPICEAALYYEAECQRELKTYRAAVDTYTKLLVQFSSTQYTTASCQGLFEIAEHWLKPTSRQMDEYHKQLQGERWFVTPAMYVNFSKDMPLLDAEGHAQQILNTIRVHDARGPMAERALMMLGTISFFRKEYKEADYYFTQLHEQHPNSENAAKAIKQSVICKQLATGGTVYDLRGVEESKDLLMKKQGAYPELSKDRKWIEDQLKMMNIQQADRDFKIAEFYQRTGHPGSAYFYYELVIRRYPGTQYAEKAQQRKGELRSKVEREDQAQEPTTRPATPNQPMLQQGTPIAPPRTLPPLDR